MKEENDEYTLEYDDSQEAKERVFNILLKWFKKVDHFSGDSLGQSDDTYIEAPELLAEIAEEGFKFGQTWADETF